MILSANSAETKRQVPAGVRQRATSKPSICFVALRAYNVLSGQSDIKHIGGAEVQQVQVATWLVNHGYHVSFVTLDHGQADGMELDGIRIFKAYAREAGIPGLRFFHPRWSGLWAAMSRANSDVYYQRCAESETGQVALWCRLHGRKFVFAAACDSDCDSSLFALRSWKDRSLYRLGLRLADAVTAQTTTQQRLLRQNMGVATTLVRNCGPTAGTGSVGERPSMVRPEPPHVLWVGRFSKQKRLEWLFDVAERCPEIAFDVVGSAGTGSDYASLLTTRAARVHNVKMHGSVPYSEMTRYYLGCHVLCCTSAYEGFPNIFLEAWSLGIPVLSTFDPDEVIAANGLGWVARDVEGMVACLKRITQSPEIWDKASKAAKEYYLANYTPEACLPAFERLLLRVTGCETNP